jgi:hypothetical protein
MAKAWDTFCQTKSNPAFTPAFLVGPVWQHEKEDDAQVDRPGQDYRKEHFLF